MGHVRTAHFDKLHTLSFRISHLVRSAAIGTTLVVRTKGFVSDEVLDHPVSPLLFPSGSERGWTGGPGSSLLQQWTSSWASCSDVGFMGFRFRRGVHLVRGSWAGGLNVSLLVHHEKFTSAGREADAGHDPLPDGTNLSSSKVAGLWADAGAGQRYGETTHSRRGSC